jgi:hypothetical protein
MNVESAIEKLERATKEKEAQRVNLNRNKKRKHNCCEKKK